MLQYSISYPDTLTNPALHSSELQRAVLQHVPCKSALTPTSGPRGDPPEARRRQANHHHTKTSARPLNSEMHHQGPWHAAAARPAHTPDLQLFTPTEEARHDVSSRPCGE